MVVLKLQLSLGSQKENIFLHARRLLTISDLKSEICRVFKIPLEQQFIFYKGNNLHECPNETPLNYFGLENNSQISIWAKVMANSFDFSSTKETNNLTNSNNCFPNHNTLLHSE